jgi:hypothetical protein
MSCRSTAVDAPRCSSQSRLKRLAQKEARVNISTEHFFVLCLGGLTNWGARISSHVVDKNIEDAAEYDVNLTKNLGAARGGADVGSDSGHGTALTGPRKPRDSRVNVHLGARAKKHMRSKIKKFLDACQADPFCPACHESRGTIEAPTRHPGYRKEWRVGVWWPFFPSCVCVL